MAYIENKIASITKRKIKEVIKNPEKTASVIKLKYVHDSEPGIKRLRKGKLFQYIYQDKKLNDKDTLLRIKSLVIPPAWENVWICNFENGHLQATGLDIKKRKQYKYHPLWNSFRNQTKYFRLLEFGKILPAVRLQVEKDLALQGLPLDKVLAIIVSLMQKTNIRVGNNFYEKVYGSFGLTTLKNRHVVINGTKLQFLFRGKKGVEHNISLKSKRLASLVAKCKDIPGKELFQYYDESGVRRSVDSGLVNEYIKRISAADFSAKDFRTWAGTVKAFLALKELGNFETVTEGRKKIVEALDIVAKDLGNTRNVCKKYYVHPSILNLYENNSLPPYKEELEKTEKDVDRSGLTREEAIVMSILEKA